MTETAQLPTFAEVVSKAPRENFGVAPLLLPRRTRRHLLAVYAFARLVDDVGEDFRRGRVYLPAEDLRDFGVDEDELGRAEPTPALRRLIEFEVARARSLLGDGRPLVRSLRGRARLLVAGYVAGGTAALDAVERSGYSVLASSPRALPGARRRAVLWLLRETLW